MGNLMQHLIWKEEYSVNIELFDEQHQTVFHLINKLSKNLERSELLECIYELINYSIDHFYNEEVLFQKYNYQHRKQHVKEHQNYSKRIKEYRSYFLDDVKQESDKFQEAVHKELLAFLNGWWVNHIQNSDQKYSDYLVKMGV
jgi:hemerythrin